MHPSIARMIVQDHNAYRSDRTGNSLCPNLEQVALAHSILDGKAESDHDEKVLPYFRPADAPAVAPIVGMKVEVIERHKVSKTAVDPVIAELGRTHGAVAAAHGLKLSAAQQADIDTGRPISPEQASRMPSSAPPVVQVTPAAQPKAPEPDKAAPVEPRPGTKPLRTGKK